MKKKRRSRKKRKLERAKETMKEKMLRHPKGHGGRVTQVIKDKTKYDRNRDKKVVL
jgi:hypothetical protein